MKAMKKALAAVLILLLLTNSGIQLPRTAAAIAPAVASSAAPAQVVAPAALEPSAALANSAREKAEILVKYKSGAVKSSIASGVKASLKLSKLEAKGKVGVAGTGLELLAIDSRDDISRVVSELAKNPNVEYAQPNYLLSATSIVDSRFAEQWGLANTGQASGIAGVDVAAIPAWGHNDGTGVVIGVLDTGIDLTHPDLQQNIFTNSGENPANNLDDDGNGYIDDLHGWNFAAGSNNVFSSSEDAHGTEIAGIIAAAANDQGIRGVAPGATIVPLKFMTSGSGYTSDAIEAIAYAKQLGIKIVNCSFGSTASNPALRDVMADSGLLFIAAAGNDASDTAVHPVYPAAFDLPNVLSVAAIDNTGQLAAFSNYGAAVDVAAPGAAVLTTQPSGYGPINGTSAAAAFVTGVAALTKAEFSDLGPTQLAARIQGNVQPLTALQGKVATAGLVNAAASLTGTLPASTEPDPESGEPTDPEPNPDGELTSLAADISPALLEMIHYGETGINPATGNYSRRDIDLSVNAPGFVVNISRTYNSKDTRTTSFLGKGWTFGFEGNLKQDTTNSNLMIARLPSGAAQVFIKSGNDYIAYDSRSTLVKLADNSHVLITKDQYSYGFSSAGWLVWMKDRNGNALNIQIDDQATGKIGKIVDTVGREYVLTYNASNYIWKIAGPENTVIEYLYTGPLLTGIKDAAGIALTCEYDANGRLAQVVNRVGASLESVSYGMSGMGGVYAIGGYYYDTDYGYGYQSNKVYRYDTATGAWTSVAIMNHARLLSAAAAVNNIPFVFGGNIATNKVEAFDVLSGTWKMKADMLHPRQGHAAVFVNGKVYLIGGTYSGYPTAVDEYDPSNDTWSTKQGSMPTARSSLAAVECDGKIYAIGGTGPSGTYLSTVEVYDPIADSWVTKRPMPTARYGLTATVMNGKIYAIGGYNGTQLGTVEEYDPISDTWTAKQTLSSEPRYHHAAAVTGSGVLVVGGMFNGWYRSSVFDYNPGNNLWSARPLFPYLVYGLTAVTIDSRSYLCDQQGNRQSYEYNSATRMATITDSAGRVTTKWYDSTLHVIKSRDPEGKETTVEYYLDGGINARGEEKSITDRYGNKTEYVRDDRGNITKIINPDQSFREFAYDAKNNLIMEKDEEGKCTYYVYDADGINLLKEVRPLNGTDVYAGLDTPNFSVTAYSYYSASEAQQMTGHELKGLLRSVTDPEGNATRYTYDAYGNKQTVTDPGGNSTNNTYNALGWLTESISPEGHKTTFSYSPTGQLEKTVLADGDTTRYTYDREGRKTGVVSPNMYDASCDTIPGDYTGSFQYRYQYYPSGLLQRVTDALGHVTEYAYDAYGNKVKEILHDGSRYEYEYDLMNRLSKVQFRQTEAATPELLEQYDYNVLPGGRTQTVITKYLNDSETAVTRLTYDYANRLVEKQNPDGGVEVTSYNKNGTIQSVTDPNGATTHYAYDGLNRLTGTWSPVEPGYFNYLGIQYDLAGRKLAELHGKDKVRLLDLPLPDRVVTQGYSYYPNGKLASQSNSSGQRTEYEYDRDGHLARERQFTAEHTYNTIEYDNNHRGQPVVERRYLDPQDLVGEVSGLPLEPLLTVYHYDRDGNLISKTSPDGVTSEYAYDQLDRLVSVSLPITDENGLPAVATASTEYNWQDKPKQVTDGNGNVTISTYDSRGRLTDLQRGSGDDAVITLYRYDLAGRLIAEVSPQNYLAEHAIDDLCRTEYSYDASGRIIAKEVYVRLDPVTGEWERFVSQAYAYDLNGNLIKELDGEGFAAGSGSTTSAQTQTGYGTEYTYNQANKLVTRLDPETKLQGLPYSIKYQYDGLNRKISETKANGVVIGYYYDDAGNLASTTSRQSMSDPEQVVQHTTFDLLGHPLSVTDANGNTVTYTYNAFGRVRSATHPGDDSIPEYSVSYRYDVRGNLAEQLDSLGQLDTYSYDQRGLLLSHTESNERGGEAITTERRYDQNGNLRFEVDGNGAITEHLYDSLNRLEETRIAVNGAAGQIVHSKTYSYDASGNLLSETDRLGNSQSYQYDSLGRLIKRLNTEGTLVQELTYNRSHVQIKSSNISGDGAYVITEYAYDRNNRPLTATDPLGRATSQTYDKVGNIRTKTDGNGNTTTHNYDQHNRLASVVAANGDVTVYAYDPNGNLISQRDPAGNTQYFEHNARNLLVRRIDPEGRSGSKGKYQYDLTKVESYRYNADGTLAQKLDRNGITTTYTYDIHRRLLCENAGGSGISYTYDQNGNTLTMTDSTGTTAQSYDELGRVVVRSVPQIGVSVFQYDLTEGLMPGHVKETTRDVKGNITEREYDRLGRLVKVTSDGETVEYRYYQDGNRKSVTYPSASEVYTYDAAGQLSTLVNSTGGTIIDSYAYTYDAAGNQLTTTDNKGVISYAYDQLNRLSKVTEPNGHITDYTYDKAGNRKTETVINGTSVTLITYEYNPQNRLMVKTEETASGSRDITKYSYDHNGNLIYQAVESLKPINPEDKPGFSVLVIGQIENEMSRRVAIYAYDTRNQLVSAKTGGSTAEYIYNGAGLRVQKTVNGETTAYVYEGDRVVLELDRYGNQQARNVYGINLLARTAGDEKYYYLYNGHADVVALINASGSEVASYYYDAFGNILEQTGAIESPILYAGYQYDPETGLYYLNARMYDPKIARFLQEDTYRGNRSDPLSLHFYAYCFNNPLRYFDPTGHRGAAVRAVEEQDGNSVHWVSRGSGGLDTITVSGNGSTRVLVEGKDFVYENGVAYYVSSNPSSSGALVREVEENAHREVQWNPGVGDDPSTITVTDLLGTTSLIEGRDFTLGSDGRARYKDTDAIDQKKTVGGTIPLSDGASVALLALGELYSVYEAGHNASGMDAVMRTKRDILSRSGPELDYSYVATEKTTRVTVDQSIIFSLERIHAMHRQDALVVLGLGSVPGLGKVLGAAASISVDQEQGRYSTESMLNDLTTTGISFLDDVSGSALSIGDYINSYRNPSDTYWKDGVEIRENDACVIIRVETNQGLSVSTFKAYLRNNEVLHFEQFGPYSTPAPNPQFDLIIKNRWKREGYK